jgi:hypothetical protein
MIAVVMGAPNSTYDSMRPNAFWRWGSIVTEGELLVRKDAPVGPEIKVSKHPPQGATVAQEGRRCSRQKGIEKQLVTDVQCSGSVGLPIVGKSLAGTHQASGANPHRRRCARRDSKVSLIWRLFGR